MKPIITFCICLFFSFQLIGQNKYTYSGYIKDASSGETLVGANLININDTDKGASSNAYGFYSLTLDEGEYTFVVSYLGYQEQVLVVTLDQDVSATIELSEGVLLGEVTISAEEQQKDSNVESTQLGVVDLPVSKVKKLPALMGEVDILKALQLLPGVASASEGSSGFYVRGGGPDQNLVLLDEAVVYNTGHMLGFFSVFNADVLKNTKLIKGGMPAYYGGRLSSVVDVQMKEGNDKYYGVEGGVGLISSRLTMEGPIVKEKSSFIISGRRTYILDLVQPFLKGGNFEGTNYYFYDLNTKVNYRISDKDRLYLSGYFGRDVLKFNQPKRDFSFTLPYGNITTTLRWNHLFNDKLFFNLSAIYNDYQLEFEGGQSEFNFNLFSGVRDYNVRFDFDYFPNPKHNIKYGLNYTYHTLTPNTASATNGEVNFNSPFEPKYGQEIAGYIQDDFKVNKRFSLNAGLRYSLFSQLGPYTSKLDGTEYGNYEPVVTYDGFEPRISAKYSITQSSSVKGAVTLTNQYLHLASNSSSTLPTDLWVPSTEIVKPQQGIQYALGFFKNLKNNAIETSVEIYYKDLKNQIDYSDDVVPSLSQEDEDLFVFGKGRSYGAEFFVSKSAGRLTGWLGYTLSKTERSFDEIEGGRWYPTVFDRRNDLSVVVNYKISPKWEFGGTFVYGDGRNFTPYESFAFIEGGINTIFGPRNSAQLAPYHRIDLSLTFTPKANREKKKYKGSWNFSVYNAYNRKNPFFTFYESEISDSGAAQLKAFQVTIFPIIPSISYNFRWSQNPK